jgi:hypothetical protein
MAGADTAASSTATVDRADATQENNSSFNVTVGKQLSTWVATTNDEVQTDFEDTTFEIEYEGGDESDRAEAVADRNEELSERAEEIRESYREATEAYEEGDISRSEYAQRVAELNARAENVLESHQQLQERADNVSDAELSAAGVNESELRAAADDLEGVTGAGADALLQRFTGQRTGEVEIESSNGVEIEVSSEDGERSREFQRTGDGDTNITVNQTDALDTARTALSGNWSLTDANVDDEHGTYEFEFVYQDSEGEAEITVDGSSGSVVDLEEEIESDDESDAEDEREEADESDAENETEDEDEREDENETEHENETMSLDATVENDSVSVTVTHNGSPVEDATVYANDQNVGTTDADGTLTFTPPNVGEEDVEIEVEKDDLEAENTYDYPETTESEDDDSDDDTDDTSDDDSDDTTDDDSTDDDD